MDVSGTTEQIRRSTEEATDQIRQDLEYRLAYYVEHPEFIDQRLRELDEEWDIERSLEANASGLIILATLFAILGRRRYLLVALAVSGFLLQHALTGWSPPWPLLRRLGLRTQYEIELERYALKFLRGDFDQAAEQRTKPDGALKALDGREYRIGT